MAHTCQECLTLCYCDGDDTHIWVNDYYPDCRCDCDPDDINEWGDGDGPAPQSPEGEK